MQLRKVKKVNPDAYKTLRKIIRRGTDPQTCNVSEEARKKAQKLYKKLGF